MKKLFLLSFILLGMLSCTSEEVSDKTSISASISQESSSKNSTSKEIKRGSIYAWVKDITLVSTNNETGHVAKELFTLVDNDTPGAESGVFRLNNVAIGINSIKATSTTNTTGEASFNYSTESSKDIISKSISKNPYAVYESPLLSENIQHNPNNVIKIPMNTNNGRVIGVFSAKDDYLLKNYKIIVSADIVEANGDVLSLGSKQITSLNSALFYWSNENAIQGAKVKYVISIFSIKTGLLVNTMQEEVAVKSSISYSCNYLISTPTNFFKDDNKFDFVFQPWKEETCPTCPGN
jgi:hypothetical protein